MQKLYLSKSQLALLPEFIGHLTQLTSLDISDNLLTTLPESIGQLEELQNLDLSGNPLRVLPETVRNCTKLNYLSVMKIPSIVSLAPVISKVISLREINFWNCKSKEFPSEFLNLVNLTGLYAGDNKFTFLPPDINRLRDLNRLIIKENNLTDIPPSLAQLEHLKELLLDNNPLNPALQSAYDKGLGAVKAYLRSLEDAEPLYEAKLVLVGEGDVGKTTLLKALKSNQEEGPREGEPTTHGIDISTFQLPHPEKDDVQIQLNAWDFGGQNVYRVTHQFFFSRRSLYILVWEPRGGVQKGQVEDWLNMIRLRVGADARVIIVSTHAKTGERIARIDQPVFLRDYPDMIAGFYEVDSLVPDEATGEMFGIAALKEKIAEEAAQLEQMGMLFNNNWKAARDELIGSENPRISYTKFAEDCAKHTLSEIDTSTLAGLMHDLGYIVHYGEDENLRNDVVLKPQWLTKAIGFVLEDRATQDADGILPDERLFNVWHDHQFKDEPRYTPELYPFFLRLMEKYDVSYRLPDGKASLVAQHVPQVRPDLPWLPEQEGYPRKSAPHRHDLRYGRRSARPDAVDDRPHARLWG